MTITYFGVVLFFITGLLALPQPPVIPKKYYVDFSFGMPQWENSGIYKFEEPAQFWYDGASGMERVQFWGGVDKTVIKRIGGEKSQQYTAWQSYPKGSSLTCTKRTIDRYGVKEKLADAFPAKLDQFKFVGHDTINGKKAQVWFRYEYEAGATNNYTFYVADTDQTPLVYDYKGFSGSMLGYDHSPNYDWFRIQYNTYMPHFVNESDFDLPYPCTNDNEVELLPPKKVRPNEPLIPMGMEDIYQESTQKFGWTHKEGDEKNYRKSVFRKNVAYIHNHNQEAEAGKHSYTLAVNHLADKDHHTEQRPGSGCFIAPDLDEFNKNLIPFSNYSHLLVENPDLPTSVDWRTTGKVSVLKEQGDCGSCWSFGATGAAESAYAIKKNVKADLLLSEQFLLDCSWPEGNMACGGGGQSNAYTYAIKSNGGKWPSEGSYKYRMNEGYCQTVSGASDFQITSWNSVPNNEVAFMGVVANQGPVTIGISTMPAESWSFYHSGVYDNPGCKPNAPDHAVLVVGYGTENGKPYWLVKNSWSKYWGEDGYIKIARDGATDTCGVTQFGVIPVVA